MGVEQRVSLMQFAIKNNLILVRMIFMEQTMSLQIWWYNKSRMN